MSFIEIKSVSVIQLQRRVENFASLSCCTFNNLPHRLMKYKTHVGCPLEFSLTCAGCPADFNRDMSVINHFCLATLGYEESTCL